MTFEVSLYQFDGGCLILNRGEGSPTVLVNMHPAIADYLYENESEEIEMLETNYNTSIIPVSREGYHQEQFEIVTGASS